MPTGLVAQSPSPPGAQTLEIQNFEDDNFDPPEDTRAEEVFISAPELGSELSFPVGGSPALEEGPSCSTVGASAPLSALEKQRKKYRARMDRLRSTPEGLEKIQQTYARKNAQRQVKYREDPEYKAKALAERKKYK